MEAFVTDLLHNNIITGLLRSLGNCMKVRPKSVIKISVGVQENNIYEHTLTLQSKCSVKWLCLKHAENKSYLGMM